MVMGGKFVVLCGGEGSGKTTQVALLLKVLEKKRRVLLTKEPGGDAVGQKIREILLDPKNDIADRAELLLFEANRAQHVEKVIAPALKKGTLVISDRFDSDTFAYQCGARDVCADDEFEFLNAFATGGLVPNLYIYVDIDPKLGLERKREEGVETRFEKEKFVFHQKVRQGFKDFLQWMENDNVADTVTIDGSQSVEEVHSAILEVLKAKQLI